MVYHIIFSVGAFFFSASIFSQTVIPVEIPSGSLGMISRKGEVIPSTDNKKLPAQYRREMITALSYFPELKEVPVSFRVRRSRATVKTRPEFLSLFLPREARSYVIIISNKTAADVSPLMFSNLPEAARIGILGHELSHVADFSRKTVWQSVKMGLGHLSSRYLDSLEYHTDKICIDHGMGDYLASWSEYVRKEMHTTNWRGVGYANEKKETHERYMNPVTIRQYITRDNSSSIHLARSATFKP